MSMTSSIYDVELYANSFLFTLEEFSNAKSHSLLPVKCSHCGETFYCCKKEITRKIKNNKTRFYCNRKCSSKGQQKQKEHLIYTCKTCGKTFTELPSKYASGYFCSRSCANKYSSQFANTEEKRLEKSNSLKEYNNIHRRKRTKVISQREQETKLILSNIQSMYEDYNFFDMSNIINIPTDRIKSIAKKHNIEENKKFLPSKNHAVIRLCKTVLNKETSITKEDFNTVKNIIIYHIYNDNMSPLEIGKLYNYNHPSFHTFLINCFGITLKSLSEANISYHKRIGTYDKLSEKDLYYKKSQFKFGILTYKNIKGYELVEQYGVYNALTNKNGVSRDHMISINYGWTHNIPPEIISHPANCEIMTQSENSKKNSKSSITLEELKERIANWK